MRSCAALGGPKARSAFTRARSRSSAYGFAGYGAERGLPSWENAVSDDLLGKRVMNQDADQCLGAAFQVFDPIAGGHSGVPTASPSDEALAQITKAAQISMRNDRFQKTPGHALDIHFDKVASFVECLQST